MPNVQLLDPAAHRELRVFGRGGAAFGDARHFVQVTVRELPRLIVHYPVFFSKDAETGAFVLGAVLGFEAGENLFLTDEGWGETYRPLDLQRAPFFVAGEKLAIDMDSPRVGHPEGERLFDDAGTPTDHTNRIMAAFSELKAGLPATRAFIDQLLAHQLIEPIDVDLSFDDGRSLHLADLYTISAETVRALPDEAALDLFRRGYLHLISLMIASVKQVPVLAGMRNRRLLDPRAVIG